MMLCGLFSSSDIIIRWSRIFWLADNRKWLESLFQDTIRKAKNLPIIHIILFMRRTVKSTTPIRRYRPRERK